jgi:hypothetical protein
MKRMMLVGLLVCALLPCLMGATCTISTAQGNFGGMPGFLRMTGSYALGPTETYNSVQAYADNPNTGVVAPAVVVGLNWDKNHTVSIGTYSCWAQLKYRVNGGSIQTANSSTMNATVTF